MLLYEDFPTDYHANVNTSMTSHTYAMTSLQSLSFQHRMKKQHLDNGMALNGVPIIMIEKVEM
jgi:hypothetical protein